jgi:epoxyqueuosine reductase QueG
MFGSMTARIKDYRQELERVARGMGAKAFGIADLPGLKTNKPDLFSRLSGEYERAIVFGVRLQRSVLEDIVDRPTPLYFHNYRQVNYQLDNVAMLIADMIQDAGFRAVAIPASQIVTKDPMRGHISHKLLGLAAGIGFIGRSTLLIHPQYGAQVRYVSVLTDMPLEPDAPYADAECGDCMACVAACPAKAIGGKKEDFNLSACFARLQEATHISFVGQHICGVCLKACCGKTKVENV